MLPKAVPVLWKEAKLNQTLEADSDDNTSDGEELETKDLCIQCSDRTRSRSFTSNRKNLYGQRTPTLTQVEPESFSEHNEISLNLPLSNEEESLIFPQSSLVADDYGILTPVSSSPALENAPTVKGCGFVVTSNGLTPSPGDESWDSFLHSEYFDSEIEDGVETENYKLSYCSRLSISKVNGPNLNKRLFNKEELHLIRVLGHGATGTVTKAFHVTSLHIVAIKSVPVNDPNKRNQMLSEIKALHDILHHGSRDSLDEQAAMNGKTSYAHAHGRFYERFHRCPYIVHFYEAYIDFNNGTINLALEWMDGGSLEDLLRKKDVITPCETARILHCVLRALKHLHELRILHRDIKPSNILMSNSSGLAKLSDFGIAHRLVHSSRTKTFIGSVNYMAPERICCDQAGYSYPADVWSLGMTIYVCTYGFHPFKQECDENGFWGLAQATKELPIPLLEVPNESNAHKKLCDFIMQCLQRNPVARPSSAELLGHPFLSEIYSFETTMANKMETDPKCRDSNNMEKTSELHRLLKVAAGFHLRQSIRLDHTLPRFHKDKVAKLMKQLSLPTSEIDVQKSLALLNKFLFSNRNFKNYPYTP